jgi:hypothetical protein
MKLFLVGISASEKISPEIVKATDFIEIKKITTAEVIRFQKLTDGPLFFHLQYRADGTYFVPSAHDLRNFFPELDEAYRLAQPVQTSLHFGMGSRSVEVDAENYVGVAASQTLSKKEVVEKLEKNLQILRSSFPETLLLVENIEFVPEAISKGAYRHVQEAEFFSSTVKGWHDNGILDGIVFDVPHGLITAGNHPFYNGLSADPTDQGWDYVSSLNKPMDLLNNFHGYVSQMPLSLVREIHISGISRLQNGAWVDSHLEIGEMELKALEILIEMMGKNKENSIPVTLEYSRSTNKIQEQIVTLKSFGSEFEQRGKRNTHVADRDP